MRAHASDRAVRAHDRAAPERHLYEAVLACLRGLRGHAQGPAEDHQDFFRRGRRSAAVSLSAAQARERRSEYGRPPAAGGPLMRQPYETGMRITYDAVTKRATVAFRGRL